MSDSKSHRSGSQKRQALQKNVALYPVDIEAVERLQRHHQLDSFSQAVRRAIRDAERQLPPVEPTPIHATA